MRTSHGAAPTVRKRPHPPGIRPIPPTAQKTPDSGENGGNGDDAPALSVDLGDGIVLTGITPVDGAVGEEQEATISLKESLP